MNTAALLWTLADSHNPLSRHGRLGIISGIWKGRHVYVMLDVYHKCIGMGKAISTAACSYVCELST